VSAATVDSWVSDNQRLLVAALAELRARFESDRPTRALQAIDEKPAGIEPPPALEALGQAFGLSAFEQQVLLVCAGVELDTDFARDCARALGREGAYAAPTFSLMLSVIPGGHWSALAPAAPLRYWRLLELTTVDSLVSSPLKIDERILHYLVGVQYLDERLQGLVGPPAAVVGLPPSHAELAAALADTWRRHAQPPWPLIALLGEDRAAKVDIAAAAGSELGLEVRVLTAECVPAAAAEQEELRRLWARESALRGQALLVDCETGVDDDERRARVTRFVEEVRGPLIVASEQPLRGLRRATTRLDVRRPRASEQRDLFLAALGDRGGDLNGRVDELVAQFDLPVERIRAATAEATERPSADGELAERLWDACRTQARTRLDDLAQRLEPTATRDDIVLPDLQLEVLRDITLHVRHRTEVYEHWGFAAKSSRGLGISALFAGPSGTGKTMAAEVLARELRLDLYRIDLSSVVSKYIGETEKNLRRVFDAAEESGAILLFDEADALFGKRTEVKDSHDRYANIEVSYLLQRMESYRGLAILTTNFRTALDTAFTRRLRFVVEFPFPRAAEREEIWRRIFPAPTPVADLDLRRLGRLNVAGGSIRNIALNAAFLAAAAGEAVTTEHVVRAARREYAKVEQPLTGTELEAR
jgi:SpoVK/Ycf46/Vps4 family AAA+-type ATPase